jgi:hypothetical protein
VEPGGGISTVVAASYERHPAGIAVYNFRVSESHTYFVREQGSAGEPVWVHNADYGLPATTEESVADKLQRYLLNPDHPVGGPKAKFFEEALGFTQDNAGDLAKQLVFNPAEAVQTEGTQFGPKFEQTISVFGANGRTIPILTVWIRNLDGVVRLITAYPGD